MRALAAALCLSISVAPAAAQDVQNGTPMIGCPPSRLLINPVTCQPGRTLVTLNGARLADDPAAPDQDEPAVIPKPPARRPAPGPDRGFIVREPYYPHPPAPAPPEEVIPREELGDNPEMEALVRRLSEQGLRQSQEWRQRQLQEIEPR